MEPMMNNKREASALVPHKWRGENLLFYIQKRDEKASRAPGLFGFFGGGIEKGESVVEAMMREIQEELQYTPTRARYFSRYEAAHIVNNIFIEEVNDDFESKIKINEGEYRKFFSLEEALAEPKVAYLAKLVLFQISDVIKK
jgi:8-oxo-dGTP pyrophosphatase MutT (NUDIX family)